MAPAIRTRTVVLAVVAVCAVLAGAALLFSDDTVPADAAKVRPVLLLGNPSVERSIEMVGADHAAAFSFYARRSGTATAISLYVRSATRARRVEVAIYSSAHRRPSKLLMAAAARRRTSGRWVRIGVKSVTLKARHRYWLAILGTGGSLGIRVRRGSACSSRVSVRSG
jgi:hypothetical protein